MTARPATELVRNVLHGAPVGSQLAANWLPTGGHVGTHHARYATLAVLGCPEHGLTAEEGDDGIWRCRLCERVLETCRARALLP